MGKHEVGTPKYIANKIKAKGLQKLRWYCQMCQKQCRDENGFKCHTMSESHQRQLLIFADNSNRYIDEFSREFSSGYLELLKRMYGTKRVPANKVYQDYISDRHHLHMNATRWETLTEFVKWLGREGKCVVDETEKGWFVSYIDRDPEAIALQEAIAKKEKMDKDDQEKMMQFLKKQIERGKKDEKEVEYTELKRESEEEKIKVDLNLTAIKPPTEVFLKPKPLVLKRDKPFKEKPSESQPSTSKRKCALDDILIEEERKKERKNRKDYWVCENIVVKVVTKSLGDKYYKKKGVIESVKDKYVAMVRMTDTGDLIKLDQEHLETVIPSEGRLVKIVNGAYRGETATLKEIYQDKFCAKLEIATGLLKGRVISNIQYEDFSKLDTSSTS